jgi:ankyrin repeat protein
MFIKSCITGNLYIIKYLISKGANHFNSGLDFAAAEGNLEVMKYLIEQKYVEDANSFNNALYSAVFGGNLETVKYLIEEKGAKIFNETLEYAAIGPYGQDISSGTGYIVRGHLEVVKYLIDLIEDGKGAISFNTAIPDADGPKGQDRSSETGSIVRGHMEVVEYLINKKGPTYYDY